MDGGGDGGDLGDLFDIGDVLSTASGPKPYTLHAMSLPLSSFSSYLSLYGPVPTLCDNLDADKLSQSA